jgi:hypothetical protein
VQVEIKQQEYQPLFAQLAGPGPFYLERYEITVSRVKGENVYPPHLTVQKESLDACIEYLQTWGVGAEEADPWHPDEVWTQEEAPGTEQAE